MHEAEHRAFAQPDEVREFPHGRAEIVKVGSGEVGRYTFEPGWRWSNDVKPIANTTSCEAPHFQYHVSGQLAILMDDGTEIPRRSRRGYVVAERSRRLGGRGCTGRYGGLVRCQQLRQPSGSR